MPSIQHEAMVQLFRNRPGLAAQLLERALGLRVPAHREARLADATLTQVEPTEYLADAVIVLHDQQRAVHAIVVEVQLGIDAEKTWSWPAYATTLRSRERCQVTLLVVTPEPTVAAWAGEPMSWCTPHCTRFSASTRSARDSMLT